MDDVEWRRWEQGEGICRQRGNCREHRIVDCFVINTKSEAARQRYYIENASKRANINDCVTQSLLKSSSAFRLAQQAKQR